MYWVISVCNAVLYHRVLLFVTSVELGCKMNFGIYLPPKAESAKVPVIYWLSGKKYYSFIAAFALLTVVVWFTHCVHDCKLLLESNNNWNFCFPEESQKIGSRSR